MNKEIVVVFEEDECTREKKGLVQWDKGIRLRVYGLTSDYDAQIHFSLNDVCGNAVPVQATWESGALVADIPQFILEGDGRIRYQRKYNAYAFIYLLDAEVAETVRKIVFEIKARPKPEDYIYEPEEVKTWEELEGRIKALEQDAVVVDSELSEESENPVQNKAIAQKFADVSQGLEQLSDEIVDQQNQHDDLTLRVKTLEDSEGGATAEQIKQIEQNKKDIDKLSEEIVDLPTFVVDLEKYNIQSMTSHLPPFTNKEYEIANNNAIGINRAFDDAHKNGYTKVSIPYGNYPLLYQNNDDDRMSYTHYYIIKPQNNTKYDFNHGELWVMFDSDNPSPYYTYSDANYYKAGGKVVGLANNTNVEICNLTITGDRDMRSYTNESERNIENTTGIISVNDNDNITIRNVICQTFMADGFSGGTAYGKTSAFVKQNYAMTQGFVNYTNGTVLESANANNVYSELIDISVLKGLYANIWSGLGYQYVLGAHPSILALFYDEEGVYISHEETYQSYNFYVPTNAKYIRVVFVNVFEPPNTTQSFRITSPSSQNFLLENVIFRNNCRGGVSNVPNFTTFRKCKFYHNGKTSYAGSPRFGDSTRYAMDIEDIQSAGVTIDDCDEYDNGNGGFFLGAIDVTISNSRVAGISLYRGVCYHITNSLIRKLRATDDYFDEVNYFVEASNSTIVTVGLTGTLDLTRLSNCDIICNSLAIKGPSHNNRIYHTAVNKNESLYVEGDLAFTGYIKNLANARGKVIGVEGFSKFECEHLNNATQIKNCECVYKDDIFYINTNQLHENCIIHNLPSIRNNNDNAIITFKNCDIVNVANTIGISKYNGVMKVVFENCTFTTSATANNFYVTRIKNEEETSLEFINCTFINEAEYTVYASMDSGNYKIPTFKDCIFENVTPYPSYTV